MKYLTFLFAVVLFAGVAFAESDYKALAVLDDIQKGEDNRNQIQTLRVLTDVILPAGSIVSADLAAGTIVAADIATNSITSDLITQGTITDVDVAAAAAIAGTKLNLSGVTVTNTIVGNLGATTNVIVTRDGVITSWTVTP